MLHEYSTRKEREEAWRMMAEGRNEEEERRFSTETLSTH